MEELEAEAAEIKQNKARREKVEVPEEEAVEHWKQWRKKQSKQWKRRKRNQSRNRQKNQSGRRESRTRRSRGKIRLMKKVLTRKLL